MSVRTRWGISRSVWLLILLNASLLFVISPTLALTDPDSSNNNLSVSVDVIESRELDLFIQSYRRNSFFGSSDYSNEVDFKRYYDSAEIYQNMIQSTFPISEENLNIEILSVPVVQRTAFSERFDCKDEDVFTYLKKKANIADHPSEGYSFEKILGVVPNNSLYYTDEGGEEHPVAGCVSDSRVLRNVILIMAGANSEIAPHELAHSFDICHDASVENWGLSNSRCANRNNSGEYNGHNCENNLCYLDADDSGLVMRLFPEASETQISNKAVDSPILASFMYGGDELTQSNAANYWIDNETYVPLLEIFSVNHPPIFVHEDVILVAGSRPSSGGGNFDNAMYLSKGGGYIDNKTDYAEGNISVVALNSSGGILFNYSYSPSYRVLFSDGGSNATNKTSFTFAFPAANVSVLRLYVDGALESTRTVTTNSPVVNLTNPSANQSYEGVLNISWSASDADGGTLYSAVLLSPDGGMSFFPIVLDLNQSWYAINTLEYPRGSRYVIQVAVTDGFHTSYTLKSGNFTMIPPPHLSIEELVELQNDSNRRVVEVSVVNDGGYNLSRVEWSINSSESTVLANINTSLTVGDRTILLLEYNYSTTAPMTINFTVRDRNKSIEASSFISVNTNNTSNSSKIGLSLVSPSANGNLTKNAFTAFIVQACCIQGSCGTVNVTLDPETVERSYAVERRCVGDSCDISLFSAPRFGFEDRVWKPLEELRSFIGTVPIVCDVKQDGRNIVECIDYNATHRQLRVSLASGTGTVPVRVLDRQGVEQDRINISLSTPRQETLITIPVGLGNDIHVGDTSTNISLISNTTNISGWWEITGGTLAIYNWTNCDANTYSGSDKTAISVNSTAAKIYSSAGGVNTTFSGCHRVKWDINITPANVSAIWAYAYWGGEPHNGSDSQAKALYIGNTTSQTWIQLDRKNNTFSAQTAGSIASTDLIENVSGHAYVYTLLHTNATKSSSSNGLYMEFYYTELRLTVGPTNGSSNAKGTVSNSTGATPFYVNSTNPRQITLSTSECQNVTWYMNATGTSGAAYTFFAYANLTSNLSISNKTSTINLTIVNTTGGGSGPTLIHNHTFASSSHSWGGGNNYSAYGGYYEETSDYSTIYSGDLDLTNFSAYRIVMVVWANDSNNAKFSPSSAQYSLTTPYIYYEQNGANQNLKAYNGSYYTMTTSAPKNTNITWTFDVNRTSGCFIANATWSSGSATLSSTCGVNTTLDFVHWDAGDLNGFHRVMEFQVYSLS